MMSSPSIVINAYRFAKFKLECDVQEFSKSPERPPDRLAFLTVRASPAILLERLFGNSANHFDMES